MLPVKAIQAQLSATAEIIATHPAFGPESAKDGLQGQKIMVHNIRSWASTFEALSKFLKSLELHIIQTTLEEHDKLMAYIQGLSHYIGRVMQALAIPESELAIRAYRDLLDMKNVQGNDSDDLFVSITHSNPYTLEVLDQFKTAARLVDSRFQL